MSRPWTAMHSHEMQQRQPIYALRKLLVYVSTSHRIQQRIAGFYSNVRVAQS